MAIGLLMTEQEQQTLRWRINDMAVFAKLHVSSTDIDPVYPVLCHIIERRDLNVSEAFWLVELYLAYYNLPSALTAFREQPVPEMPPGFILKLPTGVERRGLRDVRCMQEHIESYLDETEGDGVRWASKFIDTNAPPWGFEAFWEGSQTIKYNGRWAAFKWTELLVEILGYPFRFPDMRLRQCSGPREGLAWTYGVDVNALSVLEECALNLKYEMEQRGMKLRWEQLETVLCDYNSMRKGNYYIGHDIDQLQEQVEKATYLHGDDKNDIYVARKACVPREYLGEWNGWMGVDRERNKYYRDSGIVAERNPHRSSRHV